VQRYPTTCGTHLFKKNDRVHHNGKAKEARGAFVGTSSADLERRLATAIFATSPRWLFFYPGLVASLIGFAITVWLLPGKQSIGKLHLDVDTLVYALGLLLIGVIR
jgi:hypothetical protein